ncbi:MAG: hypothetical protein IPM39_27905 [Chloroflexi bacterium]|nr:hypothetical protein [Chloroflexota bacterium]
MSTTKPTNPYIAGDPVSGDGRFIVAVGYGFLKQKIPRPFFETKTTQQEMDYYIFVYARRCNDGTNIREGRCGD